MVSSALSKIAESEIEFTTLGPYSKFFEFLYSLAWQLNLLK